MWQICAVQIFITRGEDSSGPYTLEQVQDYMNQGMLLPSDLAWYEGLDNWIPLEQLIAEVSPLEEPPHPAQEAVVAPALSEPEPVVAEVAPAPVKGKSKTKLIIVAVAGLLVASGLGVGAWVLLKKDPDKLVQQLPPTNTPSTPVKPTGTETNLPPSPIPNPTNPEPTAPTNGTLTELLTSKRLRVSIEGDEFWVQLNNNGTTLDHAGLEGTFKIEGMSLSITDDDGITIIEFTGANPKEGDAVTVTGTKEPGSPPVLGPIKAKIVKLTKGNDSGTTGIIPPLPTEPNPTLPIPPPPTEPTPSPSEPQPGAAADSKAILEASIREGLQKPKGEALAPEDLAKVTSVNVRAASKGPKVKDLDYLKNCPNLEGIFMQSHEVKDLSPLAGLTKLNKINLSRNQVTDLTPLAKLPALKELWLQSNGLENLNPLASIVTLQQLYLDENPLTDLGPLGGLNRLEKLGLSGVQARDFTALKGLSSLQALTFSPPAGMGFKAVLGGMQKLKSIHISKAKIPDLNALVEGLANPEALESLTIFNGDVEKIDALAKCKNLRSISMMANGITDLSAFTGMTQLTSLILSQNKIADVTPLVEVPNLGTIWLSANRVTDITPLMKHKNLRFVLLRASQVPEEQLEQLRQAIPGCRVNNETAKK